VTLLDKIEQLKSKVQESTVNPVNPKPVNPKKVETGELTIEDIDNFNKTEWIDLRTKYANKLFWLLSIEIGALFIIIIFIGLKWIHLEEWTINIFASAVLLQSFGLVKVIVKNLFEKKTEN
jgi:hypothetical protein